jgi:hypothetical protein
MFRSGALVTGSGDGLLRVGVKALRMLERRVLLSHRGMLADVVHG